MKSWFRDMAVVYAGSENVINRDMLARVKQAAQRYSNCRAVKYRSPGNSTEKIEANANIRLTLDVMMMHLFPAQ